MATSAKPTPAAAPLPGAALLVVVVAVAFLAGTCTAEKVTIIPSVQLSNLIVKNDLARTINNTITQNFTVEEVSVGVYSESTLIRPYEIKKVPFGIPVGEVDGTLTATIQVGNRSYNTTIPLENALLADLGDVTGDTKITVSFPCFGDNPPRHAINVTVTTATGLGDKTDCLEPTST